MVLSQSVVHRQGFLGVVLGGYRLGVGVPPAPATDPNSIVAARAAAANGWQITLQNGAAARDAPDTGACWSFPIQDAFGRTLSQLGLSSIDLPRCVGALRVRERTLTAGSTAIIGVLVMDNASPIDATNGFGCAVRYPSGGSNRQVSLWRCQAGTWTESGTGTADVTTFGAQWTYAMTTTANIVGQRAYPLDATFLLDAVPGSNFVADGTARAATVMTHFGLWIGTNSSTSDTAVHTFDGSAFLLPLEA